MVNTSAHSMTPDAFLTRVRRLGNRRLTDSIVTDTVTGSQFDVRPTFLGKDSGSICGARGVRHQLNPYRKNEAVQSLLEQRYSRSRSGADFLPGLVHAWQEHGRMLGKLVM